MKTGLRCHAIVFLCLGALFLAVQPAEARPPEYAILDSLGSATPDASYPMFGSAGQPIGPSQAIGPRFVLERPTLITEIGAFVNSCVIFQDGQPQCPRTRPIIVEIRPALGPLPNPDTLLASLPLTDDQNPFMVSYEFIRTRLRLEPGAYYALFASQPDSDEGALLGSATDVVSFPTTCLGILDPETKQASSACVPAGIRILARGKVRE